MATLGVKRIELVNGDEYQYGSVYEYPEAAAQTFKKKDFVNTASGQVKLAVDTESGNFGLALEDASGTTDALVEILLINSSMIFSGTLSAAGAATATVQATHVGLQCSWIKSTVTGETTKTVVDASDTTTPSLEIILLDPRDPVGDTNGRVYFRVLPAFLIARGV
jgi:hypothetical protein